MWLFTRIGFFSVVQKDDQSHLTVRARVAVDLDRLRTLYMPELSETLFHTGTDYPYRATISHEAFGIGLSRMGNDIDYSNFKRMIEKEMGPNRAHVYFKIWSNLTQLERAEES